MSAPNCHLPSKRKLDYYDSFDTDVSRKLSNSKGTSLTAESNPTAPNFVVGEPSTQSNGGSKIDVQFFVRIMISNVKTLVLHGNLKDTVEMVHRKIHSITKIPVIEQSLIYNGKQLQWEQTLGECSVENDAGLQLVGRMRSTSHPCAWRVINDIVSIICKVCRSELPVLSCNVVRGKLEYYMTLPVCGHPNTLSLTVSKHTETKGTNEMKELTGVGDNSDDEEGKEGKYVVEGCGSINKVDYCKIFMDGCAPEALVMLYMSSENRNQECGEACIRCFVGFLKDLGGQVIERTYCATVVMKFCSVLRSMGTEDNALYRYCRSTLGSMLENLEVVSEPKDINGMSMRGTIGIKDVVLFLKEVKPQLMKDLMLSAEYDVSIEQLIENVCDFSAFLQPMLSFIRRRHAIGADVEKGEGKVSSLGEETHDLFSLFNDLLGEIDRSLSKMDPFISVKKKNEFDFGVHHSGWCQYITILKELSSISVIDPSLEEKFLTVMKRNKDAVCTLVVRYVNRGDDNGWFRKYKDVLDFESRRHLAMLLFPETMVDYEELYEMLIDRSKLLAESFEYISRAQPSLLHSGLFMEFKNEEATGPGVLREWFCLVSQGIFDPQNALFSVCPLDRRRFFPNPASKVDPLHLRYFHFSGRVIALALMHKIQVGVLLDRVFFLQLARRDVSLEDIQDADPCMFNSCKQILEMDAEFVDSDGLGLTFVTEFEELGSRKVVELCPGGKGIVVNSQNRKEYVNLIVQHHFVLCTSKQVASFAEGFTDILGGRIFRETFFQSLEPNDLDMMLHGSGNEISIEDWKAHTDYDGYQESDPQIVWFWEVMSSLSREQKNTLLFFWTSVRYLPIEGFHGLASRLFIYKSSESQSHLPSSHTCFYRLSIPSYPSKAVMEERLRVITQEHVGYSFGTW